MPADTRRLLQGLEEYHLALEQQKVVFREELDSLRNAWIALSEVYEGTAAEQFRAAWERTSSQLEDYLRTIEGLDPILLRRIDALREADRPQSGLP